MQFPNEFKQCNYQSSINQKVKVTTAAMWTSQRAAKRRFGSVTNAIAIAFLVFDVTVAVESDVHSTHTRHGTKPKNVLEVDTDDWVAGYILNGSEHQIKWSLKRRLLLETE